MKVFNYKRPDGRLHKVKLDGVTLEYIGAKDFKQAELIEGKVLDKKAKDSECALEVNGTLLEVIPYREDDSGIAGYTYTKQGKYLAVPHKSKILLIFLIIAVVTILCSLVLILSKTGMTSSFTPTVDISEDKDELLDLPIDSNTSEGSELELNGKNELSEKRNEFIGYSNAYVNKENQTLPLINPKSNETYAKQIIYLGDKILFETDLIKPDSHVDWNAYESFKESGAYTLTQVCKFYIPQYDDSMNITGFIECSVDVTNPKFKIQVSK